MATRTPPAHAKTTSDAIPSVDWNKLPRGELGRKALTSRSEGTLTLEAICSEAVNVPANRQVQVWGTVTVRSSLAGGVQAALFMDGTQIQRKNTDLLENGWDQSWTLFTSVQPSAGDHVFTLQTGVSGTMPGQKVTAIANGRRGSHGIIELVIVDVGPAYT